ncbi:hypothetical protein [Endozoicomonas sp. 8E]|uniref:hypothetical protein n=1 Tax=Endozoicomonas sp. 8E TaxID=3035692 RepID=UPI0029390821|nr:hypothetical protein [Endozoicomonas sp. 8E]WOG27802.1 hypothetical protein P6910_25185 [Endozoicomonas sp. 8E]
MNDEALEQAINALQINSVSLFATQCSIADQFFPAYDPLAENIQIQSKHLISRTEQIDFEDDEGRTVKVIRFHAEFGTRMMLPSSGELEQKALIEATFVAEYKVADVELSEEAIKEFALRNVMFNVWPYWQEYLTSTCSRMELPKSELLAPKGASFQH